MQAGKKLLFILLAVVVEVTLLIKFPLFVLRQLSTTVFLKQACPSVNASQVGQEYIFTMVVYSGLYIGRWFETFVLHIHIYKFIFCQSNITFGSFLKNCKNGSCKANITLFITAFVLSLSSIAIPILGTILEVKNGEDSSSSCNSYIYEHHLIYWGLDIIRYIHDVVIRLLLLVSVVGIKVIWSEGKEKAGKKLESETREPTTYLEYSLRDCDVTNQYNKTKLEDYDQKGRCVKQVVDIFEVWFIIPWILFYISASLETDQLLLSWRNGSSGSDRHYDFSEITLMVYNFNQIIFLTLAYIGSQLINCEHKEYLKQSRYERRNKPHTASIQAHARLTKLEKDDHYDFVPRIWGSSIKVHLDSPIYVLLLLLGILFTLMNGLISEENN